jgi:amino acid transporter
VIAVIIFIVVGIVINAGGGPNHRVYGTATWINPGATALGFRVLCSTFVKAAYAFGGTELVGLAAAETKNPRAVLPSALKQVVWRIMFLYVVSLAVVGLLVPYTDPQLTGSGGSVFTSPFVIATKGAGMNFADFLNFVILISSLSTANAATFGSSRTLVALVEYGQVWQIFGFIDRMGRPMVSTVFTLLVGLIAFLGLSSSSSTTVFNWLLAVVGLSIMFTWGSICYAHIRFRAAWALASRTVEELPYSPICGVAGAYIGLFLCILMLMATFYVGLYPIGGPFDTGTDDGAPPQPRAFFLVWLTGPVVAVFFVGYFVWAYRTDGGRLLVRLEDIDLTEGMRDFPSLETLRAERAAMRAKPLWLRIYHTFF